MASGTIKRENGNKVSLDTGQISFTKETRNERGFSEWTSPTYPTVLAVILFQLKYCTVPQMIPNRK